MSPFRALCRHTNRHTWRTVDLYYKTLDAVFCARCGQPKTDWDRKKLEVQQELIAQFGEPPSDAVPYWVICNRAAVLLGECIIATKRPKVTLTR